MKKEVKEMKRVGREEEVGEVANPSSMKIMRILGKSRISCLCGRNCKKKEIGSLRFRHLSGMIKLELLAMRSASFQD